MCCSLNLTDGPHVKLGLTCGTCQVSLLGYADPAHVHMVTHRDGLPVASYPATGNPSAGSGQVMTQRVEGDVTYQQGWDADNRLVTITDTVSGATVQFAYDADGNRVKRTDAAGTTYYAGGGMFELWVPATTTTLNSTVAVVSPLSQFPWRSYPVGTLARTYYFVGGQRVALRETSALTTTAVYLYGDALGSVSLATTGNGTPLSQQRYAAFGAVRWASGIAYWRGLTRAGTTTYVTRSC